MRCITDSPEEVGCPGRRFSFGFRDDVVVTQFIQCPASVTGVADPERGVKITNAAGTLFYVWLLEAHRRAKFRVSRGPLAQNGRDVSISALATVLFQRLQKGVIDCCVAGQEARANQGRLQ